MRAMATTGRAMMTATRVAGQATATRVMAMAMATTWALAMATRLAGDKEGMGKGGKDDGDGNEGGGG